MKCFVCGKEYQGHACPRCRFPDVQVPVSSPAEARKALKDEIDAHFNRFLDHISLELTTYFWKGSGPKVQLDHKEFISLSGRTLYQKEYWVEQQFARDPDHRTISIPVRIRIWDSIREQQMELPNIFSPVLQQIGFSLDQDFNLRMMLRNENGELTNSQPISL